MVDICRAKPSTNVEQHLVKLNEGSPTSYQTSLSRSNNERRTSLPQIPGSLCVDAYARAVGQIELSSRRK